LLGATVGVPPAVAASGLAAAGLSPDFVTVTASAAAASSPPPSFVATELHPLKTSARKVAGKMAERRKISRFMEA
jgi:hypothetical protein